MDVIRRKRGKVKEHLQVKNISYGGTKLSGVIIDNRIKKLKNVLDKEPNYTSYDRDYINLISKLKNNPNLIQKYKPKNLKFPLSIYRRNKTLSDRIRKKNRGQIKHFGPPNRSIFEVKSQRPSRTRSKNSTFLLNGNSHSER